MPGGLPETGNPKAIISARQRQSPLSCLPAPSLHYMAQMPILNASATTQGSSKGGGKALAKIPKPILSSNTYMTLSRLLVHISTPGIYPANTTQQMHPHKAYSDLPTYSYPLSPSPTLSGPMFEMHQSLQLGLYMSTPSPSSTRGITMSHSMLSSIDSLRGLVKKSSLH